MAGVVVSSTPVISSSRDSDPSCVVASGFQFVIPFDDSGSSFVTRRQGSPLDLSGLWTYFVFLGEV